MTKNDKISFPRSSQPLPFPPAASAFRVPRDSSRPSCRFWGAEVEGLQDLIGKKDSGSIGLTSEGA